MREKLFRLEESDIIIIEAVRAEQGLKSSAEAVRYIIRNYNKISKQQRNLLMTAVRAIEEKTDLLLDVANTNLVKRGDEILYPISMVESPVIQQSRKLRKSRLAHQKQKADYKKTKKGTP